MMSTSTTQGASKGYTAVIHCPAPAGDAASRDSAVSDIIRSAAEREGHLGSVVLRGGSPVSPELYMVVSFDSHATWQDWRSSERARSGIARLEQVTGVPAEGHYVDSMAGWFNLPGVSGLRTPPKWKTAAVSFLTFVPLLLVVQTALRPLTGGLHPAVSLLINSVVLLPLVTYVAMPFMTRRFRRWLYPSTSIGLVESFPSS